MNHPKTIIRVADLPTPTAGLALGIASLGWCWENAAPFQGYAQLTGAGIAAVLLIALLARFVFYPKTLLNDLAHPVVGSVAPTFAMATMVISNSVSKFAPLAGEALWLAAVGIHLIFLAFFIFHQLNDFSLQKMVPSWFVPPVGIIVANVSFAGTHFYAFATLLLYFGMVAYAIMLPIMIYRLMFCNEIVDAAKPTIAIMAAPASLSLAGYLSMTNTPSALIVAVLLGIAVLMTFVLYVSFTKLLRLPFSPAYAAFTFPLVIGSTALYKSSAWMQAQGWQQEIVQQVASLATMELYIATTIVTYVAIRYALFFFPKEALFSSIRKERLVAGTVSH
ncbi:TDT family transporter [Halodesulfovibrio sp.]|uniref:TDT family transporter n=1 Tax=Halodesulfovibrio sp. TaxID=1912772 RepID=UPI0025BEF324|nr:TDT family transporter [Halodesulfovibrio sp.]